MLTRLIAVGVVVGMGGAAAAQWTSQRFLGAQQQAAMPRARVVVEAAPAAPQRAKSPQPVEPVAVEPTPQPVDANVGSVGSFPSAPVVQSSRLGLEAASLERALSALRAGGQAQAARALADIERHLREFPRGSLELEARVARIDALLVLGRRDEAQRELALLPLESGGRNRELRLIRAELRADSDCSAALADFQVLLAQPLPAAWEERALFGRGACLLRLGDQRGAERDFASYLERYPHGRFAAQIRAQAAK
jgi:TolA-binding protein